MRVRELGQRLYESQRQGGEVGVELLSDEDLAWLKVHDPEAWWLPLIGVGGQHQKRCPSCRAKGVRVGSNFRVPGQKDEKAWKKLERMGDEGVDMQAEFECCATHEVWGEMAREAERVRAKRRMINV